MNLDDYLKTVGEYADRIATAERTENRDTMSVAAAMDAMYESREWVDEWLEQKPPPKRPTSRWQADSRNRFAQWTTWKLEQNGRRPLVGRRTYQLLDAMRIVKAVDPNLNPVQIGTERNLRPLVWLLRNRYENRAPDVWAIAVRLAGGDPTQVTAKHTREALAQWKRDLFGHRKDGTPRKTSGAVAQAAAAAGKANRLRREILDEFTEMYRLASINDKARDEFEGLLSDLDAFLDEHQADKVNAA